MAYEPNMPNFNQLPPEYDQFLIDYTDRTSVSAQEVEEVINEMLKSLTSIEKSRKFIRTVLPLQPEQRILEGLYMICKWTNIYIERLMPVIKEGDRLLSGLVTRFNAFVGIVLDEEYWQQLLERGARQLPMGNLAINEGEPTEYRATENFKTILELTIYRLNEVMTLIQKVCGAWEVPHVFQRVQWVEKKLNPDSLYSYMGWIKNIRIRQVLNPTVAKCMHTKVQCMNLLSKYYQLTNGMIYHCNAQPTRVTTPIQRE